MEFIKKIFKSDNKDNSLSKTVENKPVMTFVQNETITFDENNIIQSINAGEAKAAIDNNVNYNMNTNTQSDSIDQAKLDFEFNNNPDMIKNIKLLKNEIDHASNKWGISPNLISAIISQESSGGTFSKNIMQIEFNAHHDEIINVYDFEKNKEVSLVLTNNENNPEYNNVDIKITPRDLENNHTAISIGTAILASCMQDREYNIPLGIQEYNMGPTGIRNVVQETARKEGYKTTEELYHNQTNMDFTKHTYITGNGDPDYVKNVVKYLNIYNEGNNDSIVSVKGYNPYSKEIVNEKVDFIPTSNN